jgi:DNA replicative helicase MCM subunit Mcm2 (Cdc46/Mcm family)
MIRQLMQKIFGRTKQADSFDGAAYVQDHTGGDPELAVAMLITLVHENEESNKRGEQLIIKEDILEELIRQAKRSKRPILNPTVKALIENS